METRYSYLLRFLLASTDLILINLCFFLGFYLSDKYGSAIEDSFYQHNITVCNLLWIICTGIFGLYSERTLFKLESVYRATWKSTSLLALLFLAYLFISNQADFPRQFLLFFYSLLIAGFIISRFTATALQTLVLKNFDIRKAVAVLGMNRGSLKLASYLELQSSINFVGFLGNAPIYVKNVDTPLPTTAELLREAAEAGIKEVFVSINPNEMSDLTELIKEGEKQCVRLKFVPDLSSLETHFRLDKMGNFTVLCARYEPMEEIGNRFKKRLFDIIISALVLLFIFSWMYPLLAIIIKLQSPGPVLFKQLRTGRDNKPFWCYKFRSMRMNDESDLRQASAGDERITSIGYFMRKTSLDEFPQFFNVLLGYMSIIGPRPHMLSHTEQYRKMIDKYMVRQFLKPGISGWAQVNGYRGETKDRKLMEKRVEHDIHYLENWSLMFDIKIVFLTVIHLFKGEDTLCN